MILTLPIIVPVAGKTRYIVSAGDAQLKANLMRSQYAVYDGRVKTGVISDGVQNLSQVVTAGELPAVIVLRNIIGTYHCPG